MNLKNLLCTHDGAVATVTINRADKLNALNRETLAELDGVIAEWAQDPNVRVIVITGQGEKAFVAGADIREINDLSPLMAHRFSQLGQRVMRRIERLDKPVIAMVNGFALGGGLELALSCHLRLASDNARLGLPEVKLGILPGFGGTQRLTRLIGRGQALSMMLTGEPVDAATAESMGLVNQTLSAEALPRETMALAQQLAQSAPAAMAGILEAAVLGGDMDLESGLALETARFALTCASDDMKEGTQAFLDKRAPQFTGN
ncbi:MAG: enoyl-CoA hydratase-related protein [Wenzhouxiangella sp.]|jgi:enoyl-CoA hydratase|nr:enoyl-CoA hydratase-related protein [Wenzhouxiangella sp.]